MLFSFVYFTEKNKEEQNMHRRAGLGAWEKIFPLTKQDWSLRSLAS
jgi:hypothetical protein